MRLDELIEFNPRVSIKKGVDASFVPMERLEPFTRTVTAALSKPFTSGVKFLDGDTIMARITPSLENGKTSIYRSAFGEEEQPAFGSTEFIVARAKPGVSDPLFVYYLLTSGEIRDVAIASMTGSSGRQRVQLDQLKDYEREFPSLEVQQEIGRKLGALDDKIESNQRQVVLIPDLISALIEERLLEDENRELAPVSGLARFVNGGAYTKGATGTGRMVIRIAELNSGPSGTTVYNDIEVPEDKTARAGDILMSWSGSLDVYRWSRDEAIINQHIFKVIPDGLPNWYVFDRLKAVIGIFQGIAKDKATTMGHIKRGDLDRTFVPVLAQSEVNELDKRCRPLWDKLLLLETEVHRLAALRDTLLPELLSGRMTPEQLEAGL